MKKNRLFLSGAIVLAGLVLFSCKKEEPAPSSTPTSIVGKWTVESQRQKLSVSLGSQLLYGKDTTLVFPSGAYADFKSDGTYSLMADTLNDYGKYTVNNNKLTLMGTEDTLLFDILNLQSTSVQLYTKGVEDYDGADASFELWFNLKK